MRDLLQNEYEIIVNIFSKYNYNCSGFRKITYKIWDAIKNDKICKLYKSGLSIEEIENETLFSEDTIKKVLLKNYLLKKFNNKMKILRYIDLLYHSITKNYEELAAIYSISKSRVGGIIRRYKYRIHKIEDIFVYCLKKCNQSIDKDLAAKILRIKEYYIRKIDGDYSSHRS